MTTIAELLLGGRLERFDRMRRVCNRIRYWGVTIGRAQVTGHLAHAKEIVRAEAVPIG